jgi:hypothetical protein
MRSKRRRGSSDRIFVYIRPCHILYMCEWWSSFISISSFLQQRIVQAASSLFISLLSFVNPTFTSILTPKWYQWVKFIYLFILYLRPIPVALRSNERVCGLSIAGIAGSNPPDSTRVCYMLRKYSPLKPADHSFRGVLPSVSLIVCTQVKL